LFSLSALLSTRSSAAIIAFPVATNTATIEIPTAAAFDGTNYLAGLVSGTNVGVQLILPTGSLSGSFVNVGRSSNGPALAFDGTNYLAAWSDQFVASGATMFGQFITRSGATNGPVFPLLLNTAVHGFQRIQALAFGRTNYLAVWQDANNSSLYGQFINRSGSLVGSEFSIFAQRCGAVPGLAPAVESLRPVHFNQRHCWPLRFRQPNHESAGQSRRPRVRRNELSRLLEP
jgi:hypothetical protein